VRDETRYDVFEVSARIGNFESGDVDEEVALIWLLFLIDARSNFKKQEKKRVEHPCNAPSFYDLFREVYHFAGTALNIDIIAGLLQAICNGVNVETKLLLGMIENGLCCLIYLKGNREKTFTAGIMSL